MNSKMILLSIALVLAAALALGGAVQAKTVALADDESSGSEEEKTTWDEWNPPAEGGKTAKDSAQPTGEDPAAGKDQPPAQKRSDGQTSPPDTSSDSPVVRAEAGDLGMFFRFGGLANLDHGSNTRGVNGMLLSQVGLRIVLHEQIVIPVYFGAGFRLIQPADSAADNSTDFGMEVGAGFEYHFRVWRRISPFVAVNLGLGILQPEGARNLTFGFGVGPAMGVEYYIADRVSVTVQYMMSIQFELQQADDGGSSAWQKASQISTIVGGALNITYYF